MKRVEELEQAEHRRRDAWIADYPYGVNIASFSYTEAQHRLASAFTARMLGHAVVVVADSDLKTMRFYALPLAEVKP